MPLKILLLLFAFQLCLFVSQSQQVNVTWAEKFKTNPDYCNAVQLDNGNYIVVKYERAKGFSISGGRQKDPVFMLVDAGMNIIKESKPELDERSLVRLGLKKLGNNIFYIYYSFLKNNNTTYVYAVKVNESTLLTGQRILLGTFISGSHTEPADITYKISPDSSKVLVLFQTRYNRHPVKSFWILPHIWNPKYGKFVPGKLPDAPSYSLKPADAPGFLFYLLLPPKGRPF